jgi:GDPmannose 4,6-dehydratase
MKKAVITGVTGQDGSYLAVCLLGKGHTVYGMISQSSFQRFERIQLILDKLHLVRSNLTDQSSLDAAIKTILPAEVYNLALQHFVPTACNHPVLTAEVTGTGVTRVFEAVRKHKADAKFYQASTSEMFRNMQRLPQNNPDLLSPTSVQGSEGGLNL